ncbi:MAG: hypothetical protein R6U84_00025 [Candidatus Cloacimonadales bacterium]
MWIKKWVLLLGLGLIIFGCSNNIVNETGEKSEIEMRIPRENIPEGVTAIEGRLERDGYETFVVDFEMNSDPVIGTFNSVAVGEWHLSVSAYSEDVVSYYGESDLMVNPGQNYVSLTLNPHNGSLIVEIIWNIPEEGDDFVIAFTQNSQDKNIYSYDIENGLLEQLTDNNYSTHPFYNESEDKIYYLNENGASLYRMDFNGDNKEYVGSFSHSALFPVYCESTDLYYYYYINSYGGREICIENPISGESSNLPAVNFDQYRPVPNEDGSKILYQAVTNGTTSIRLYDFSTETDTEVVESNYQTAMPVWNHDNTGFYYRENLNCIKYFDFASEEISEIVEPIDCISFYFDISTDEDYIALNIDSGNGKDLFVYSIDNSSLTQISESGSYWGFPYWCKR